MCVSCMPSLLNRFCELSVYVCVPVRVISATVGQPGGCYGIQHATAVATIIQAVWLRITE